MTAAMQHRYPASDLNGDFLRGGAGAALTLAPVALLETHWVVTTIFGAIGLLFLVFLGRTWQRKATVVETGAEGIAAHGPLGTQIPWSELDRLDLRYFSTRRDRSDGWLQLTLGAGGRTLKLESGLEGFDQVLERAADAARANRVLMSETTMQNLQTMGIAAPTDGDDDAGGDSGADGNSGAAREPWTGNWARGGGRRP